MANKQSLAEEFEKNLNELDSELDNIQKCAQEIFQKIDNSSSYPYQISSVSSELNVLLSAIQHFEKRAKNSGVTSLTTTSADIKTPNESKARLNVMVEEKKTVVDELNQESKRIADNAKAALSG